MNRVIKTCFQRDFEFIKKNLELLVTKVKLVTEIKKHNQLYFGTLVLAWYCYRGDNGTVIMVLLAWYCYRGDNA